MMRLGRDVYVMMILALCVSYAQGIAPKFANDPCVVEIITQPDDGANKATVFWAYPLATNDAENKAAAVSCDNKPGDKYAGGDNTVTCTATDIDNSETTTCTFLVRVYPTFQTGCPADFPFADGNSVTFTEPVTNLDSDGTTRPTVTCDNPATFPADDTTTVTCEATGAGSRNVSCSFAVTIGALPSFTALGSCDGSGIINTAPDANKNTASSVTWVKPTSGAVETVTCNPDPDNAATLFNGGETTVTCTVKKDAQEKLFQTCDFKIRVFPTFVTGCQGNVVDANGATITVPPPLVNPDSNNDPVIASCTPDTFLDDTVTDVTCTAQDGTETSQEVTCTLKVTLGTVPTFIDKGSCAAPGTVDIVPTSGKMIVEGGIIAGKWTKPTSGRPVTCAPDPDNAATTFQGGETDVTCTIADASVATLINTCTFKVRVFPQFTGNSCGEDVVRSPDPEDYKSTYAWINSATDKDANTAQVTCTPTAGSKFSGGENDVICTALQLTDELSTCKFKVTVWPKLDEDPNGPVTVTCTPSVDSTFSGGSTNVACSGEDPTSKLKAVNKFSVNIWPNMPDSELVQDIKRGPDEGKNVASKVDWVTPTVTGSNRAKVTATCDKVSGSEFIGGEHDVKCSALDPVNTAFKATNKFKVKVFPTFQTSCVDFRMNPSDTDDTTVVSYTVPIGASDSRGNTAEITCVPASGTAFANNKETEVTCFAVDSDPNYRNKATCSLKVAVGEVPTFVTGAECPTDVKIGPTPDKNVAEGVTWIMPNATQSDNKPATVTCDPASGSNFQGGSNLVTCSAVDSRMPSLKTTCTFNVKVYPTFASACTDQTDTPDAATGTKVVNYAVPVGATVSEYVLATVVCVPASGSEFNNNQATEVTCTATDSGSTYTDTATCIFNVLVAAAPVFNSDPSCTADVNSGPDNTGNTAVVTWTERTAKQGDDTADAVVSCNPPDGSTFKAGNTDVICTAVDTRSVVLKTECTFRVRVYPTFQSGCEDVQIDKATTGTTTIVNYDLPVGNTDSGGTNPASVTCNPAPNTAFANDVATQITCTAEDVDSVKFTDASCLFNVKVGTAPTFKATCPDIKVVAPDSSGNAAVTWNPITGENDSSGSPAIIQCNYESGATFEQPETLVTCTATDANSKRTSQCSFQVIIDSVAPLILCPASPTPGQAVDGTDQAPVTWIDPDVGYDDSNVNRPVTVTCLPKSGSQFVYGTTTVYCSAIDLADNVGQCSFEVSVIGTGCNPPCTGESDCAMDTSGNEKCICRDGYSSATDGVDCQNVDECLAATSPCHANGKCNDTNPGYSCDCKTGFFGDGVFSCDEYQTEYPDVVGVAVEKKFQVELSIATASSGADGANCEPSTNKDSPGCIALVNTFKLFVTPMYSRLSDSFKDVFVDRSQIRSGSVIIPHTVSYDYGTASSNIRALQQDQFYADTVKASVDEGKIGSLQLVKDYKSVKETTSMCTDAIKNAMQCEKALSVYEDKTAEGCQLKCGSKCKTVTKYCNGGTCTHDNTKGELCSDCPDGFEGVLCETSQINIPLIVGLSVGLGGGVLLIIICILIFCLCFKNKTTKVTVSAPEDDEEGGRPNEAMALEGR